MKVRVGMTMGALLASLGCASRTTASFPPLVFTGKADLVCNISATENGTQKLTLTEGAGVEFDARVSPLVDGVVTISPTEGTRYRFTSHLAQPAPGMISGAGKVEIELLETRVSVDLHRISQPHGPGTGFTFSTQDVVQRGAYIEFSGVARTGDGRRLPFRVTFGSPEKASGEVVPGNANYEAPLMSKRVNFQGTLTTSVQSVLRTTTVVEGDATK